MIEALTLLGRVFIVLLFIVVSLAGAWTLAERFIELCANHEASKISSQLKQVAYEAHLEDRPTLLDYTPKDIELTESLWNLEAYANGTPFNMKGRLNDDL